MSDALMDQVSSTSPDKERWGGHDLVEGRRHDASMWFLHGIGDWLQSQVDVSAVFAQDEEGGVVVWVVLKDASFSHIESFFERLYEQIDCVEDNHGGLDLLDFRVASPDRQRELERTLDQVC